MRVSFLTAGASLLCMAVTPQTLAQCPPEDISDINPSATAVVHTNGYAFSIGSASGAVGDVVALSVAVRSEFPHEGRPMALELAVCHDPEVAELVGAPLYTDEFTSLLGIVGLGFQPVDEDTIANQHGHGFWFWASLDQEAFNARFPSPTPLVMMTLYYRLKGSPGDTGFLAFCDGDLEFGANCRYNRLATGNETQLREPAGWIYLSTANADGMLNVVDGPATHPDRPAAPPHATVYPDRPTDAETNFRIRLSGAVGWPGASAVPVDVYSRADVEYVGLLIPLDFDERCLRVRRVEVHAVTGVDLVNNEDELPGASVEEGNVVIFTGLGIDNRRLAAEGEELLVATLYVDVLEAASAVTETTITVQPVSIHSPWIGVRHQGEVSTGDPAVTSEIEPISLLHSILAVRADATTFLRGDANDDGSVDISDALRTLGFSLRRQRRASLPRCRRRQ